MKIIAIGTVMILLGAACGRMSGPGSGAAVNGELRVWYPLTIDFQGPASEETANDPNPFLDYRLQVAFSGPSGQRYNVPGYYAGDGRGNGAGAVWRVRFTPDEAGQWRYSVAFRQGNEVAVAMESDAGEPAGYCDGAGGGFTILPRNPDAPGFLKWGRLEYVNGFYLKFRDGGYWIKGGTDEPENFLGYAGFDGTTPNPGHPDWFHRFDAHVRDWTPGDPDWGDGRGRGIIGALNYLASRHVNSVYLLLMNIGGDGQDVWPFAGPIDRKGSPGNDDLHYDISKLDQWETVFAHAQQMGINLYLVLGESEIPNKHELDDATLGVERKLYYREMIARFGHHNALEWNLCEEFNVGKGLTADVAKSWAHYIRQVDPYDHPVTVHNLGEPRHFHAQLFDSPDIDMYSIQHNGVYDRDEYGMLVDSYRLLTLAAGHPAPIMIDEPIASSIHDDEVHQAIDRGNYTQHNYGQQYIRKHVVYPVLFSGGSVEFILVDALATDDFRRYERLWDYVYYARSFLEEQTPFWTMQPIDDLLHGASGGYQVFAALGRCYAMYLPDVKHPWEFDMRPIRTNSTVRWYDPRSGQLAGTPQTFHGGWRTLVLKDPPGNPADDWVVLMTVDSTISE